jgi:OmpA-OmpF porin, OOP family
MAIVLTETYESLTNSDLIRSAARQLGEPESAVSTAISAAGMALLARLSHLSADIGLMNRVASLIDMRGSAADAVLAPAPGGPSAASRLGRGTALLNMVYGPRLQCLVEALADYAEISQPSARAAIGHAAPLVLTALGERLSEHETHMSALVPTGTQLANVLQKERETIALDVPPVLMAALDKPVVRIKPAVIGSAGQYAASAQPSYGGAATGGPTASTVDVAARYEIDGASLGAPALIGGLVSLALLWWLFLPGLYAPYAIRTTPATDTFGRTTAPRADDRTQRPATGPDTLAGGSFSSTTSSTPSSRTAPAAVTSLLRFIKRTLPSNKQIDFAEEGIEGRLIQLIENRGLPLERNQWFEFDRLNFQTGSSNLTADSRAQVQNIADILSSYPAVKIKIGGYTDNVGNAADNQRLSEQRAQRVMTELITLGVNALRLDAEGYGEQHPVADNATSEGRARNRRIAVRIAER